VFTRNSKTSAGFEQVSISQKKLSDGREKDDEIRFYDENRNTVHRKKLDTKSRVHVVSEQGNYLIIWTILKESVINGPDGLHQYELFDANGRRMWTKKQPFNWDDWTNAYVISDVDGSVVQDKSLEGLLIFYNPEGDTVKPVHLSVTSEWRPGSRVFECKFSAAGNYLVVGVTDAKGEIFPNQSGIILFDKRGSELWRFQAEEKKAYRVHVSPDGRFIMSFHMNDVHHEHTMYLLDMNGNLVKRYPNMAAGVIFSSDGEYVALNTGTVVKLISTEDGETLAAYGIQLGESRREGDRIYVYVGNKMIHGMDISSEKKLIVLVQGERKRTKASYRSYYHYEDVQLRIHHFNGVPACTKSFKDEKFDGSNLSIRISDDGREILTKLGRTIKKYRLVQSE